nr:MAG TPA: ChiA1-BD-binding domain protein [Caudoviricetes sp.]
MIIDGKKFTEIQDSNKSVVTFQRKVFENLKPLMDSFDSGVIHDVSFDDEDIMRKMYTEPMTFSKNKDGYMISFILTDVPQKDIEANNFKEVRPLVNDVLQTASADVVKKYVSFLNQWTPGEKYKKGQRIGYNGVPYVVESDHATVEGQTPDKTPLLYEDMTKEKKAYPWDEKVTYNKGDLAFARGIVFISKIDGNKGNEPGFGNAWDYHK